MEIYEEIITDVMKHNLQTVLKLYKNASSHSTCIFYLTQLIDKPYMLSFIQNKAHYKEFSDYVK